MLAHRSHDSHIVMFKQRRVISSLAWPSRIWISRTSRPPSSHR